MKRIVKHKILPIIIALVVIALLAGGAWLIIKRVTGSVQEVADTSKLSTTDPDLKVADIIKDLNNPMSLTFPNQTTLFYGMRGGEVRGRLLSNDEDWSLLTPVGIRNTDGFGLFSILADRDFSNYRYLYICYSGATDLRITRYEISKDLKSTTASKDILTGIETKDSKSTSCAMTMDASGTLWVGTGDSGIASAPQNPKSLAGKILRISREGTGVGGNQKTPFDDRIFSYGHRKVTSIVLIGKLLDNTAFGYAVDQGTSADEITYLISGNQGYDPNNNGAYNASAPMTDKTKFADAKDPVWATSGGSLGLQSAVYVKPERWQAWQNKLLVTATGANSARVIEFDEKGAYKSDKPALEAKYGKMYNIIDAPDGTIYGTTDNGAPDKIFQIKVVCTVCG